MCGDWGGGDAGDAGIMCVYSGGRVIGVGYGRVCVVRAGERRVICRMLGECVGCG